MNVASQFMHAPWTRHLIALHCIGELMVGPSLLWARFEPWVLVLGLCLNIRFWHD